MKYAIVYSSKTGNTAALADRLHDVLPHEHCVYFGDTSHYSPELGADLIFAGFWTDKGSCDDRTRIFLKNLQNTKVALFGTAGYAAPDYIHSILKQAEANIPVNNTVLTGFVCQGKMQPAVADKFAAMLEKDPEDAKAKLLRDTYNEGLSHPNEEDFANFKKWAEGFIH